MKSSGLVAAATCLASVHALLGVDLPIVDRQLNVYDYVIVGGGTAGLVVANRLSEDPTVSVLVIEAGAAQQQTPNRNIIESVLQYPGPIRASQVNPDSPKILINPNNPLDWDYVSVPQRYSHGEQQHLPAGRGVGGSSLINGMIYSRAEPEQIDMWEAAGNEGWNWNNLYPYYRKSETFQTPNARKVQGGVTYDSSFHGFSGPLTTGFPSNQMLNAYPGAVNASFKALGVPHITDFAGGPMRGFTVVPSTINNLPSGDVREDAGRAYYYPVDTRPNLRLMTNTTALRINWANPNASGDKVATSVQAIGTNGQQQVFTAQREIILSAGSYKSPVILEQSGVGNPNILSGAGITPVVDLPGVGENLNDQMNNRLIFDLPRNIDADGIGNFVGYLNMTDVFGTGTAQFAADTQNALPGYAAAIAAQNNNATSQADLLSLMQLQYNVLFNDQVPFLELLQHGGGTQWTCEFWSLMTFARGNIHVTSNNPQAQANINTNFWMTDYDVRSQVAGARFIRRLFAESPLAALITDERAPGTMSVAGNANDDAWANYLKSVYTTAYHPISTAIMLPQAKGGVVSNRLRVYGTANVRVIDASIIPFQQDGHTQATVYAIAERAADLIKQDAGSA